MGQPVFSYDYESVRELLVSRNEPDGSPWSARFARDGWLGPQQVTPRWLIRQAPEGLSPTDSIADGGFLLHLLDSLRQLRKVGTTLSGEDAGFGLLPARTRLEWTDGTRRFELLLGAAADGGGRYARIGSERLVVNGAALDMLQMMASFQKTRHQRLLTWTLDDADRVTIRWSSPAASWAAERSTGEWTRPGTRGAGRFSRPPGDALEALAHLQVASFDLPNEDFGKPTVTLEWLDRNDRRLFVEVDSRLRARSSDRPGAIFQLHPGAAGVLSRTRFFK